MSRKRGRPGPAWLSDQFDDIGDRDNMQDIILVRTGEEVSHWAVFDGHGPPDADDAPSALCAERAAACMHVKIDSALRLCSNAEDALKTAYLDFDNEFVREHPNTRSGSCAAHAMCTGDAMFIAHTGDCRAIVLSKDGQILHATEDHSTSNQQECTRVRHAGGRIIQQKGKPKPMVFVPGSDATKLSLMPTRALGNPMMKRAADGKPISAIMAEPVTMKVSDDAAHIVLASDGLWDMVDNNEVASFVRDAMQETTKHIGIAEKISKWARQKNRSPKDNIGIVVLSKDSP